MEKVREEIVTYIKNGTIKTEGVRRLSRKYNIDKDIDVNLWLEEKEKLEVRNIGGRVPGRKYKKENYTFKDKRTKVIFDAIKNFGEENQKLIAMEELAELQQALSKDRRGLKHNVEEEIADVKIMLWQLELMYDNNKIEEWIDKKIERLEERLRG